MPCFPNLKKGDDMLEKLERVKAVLRGEIQPAGTDAWRDGVSFGLALALEEIEREFPSDDTDITQANQFRTAQGH